VDKLYTAKKAIRPVLVKVLDAAAPSLKELAAEAGISYRAIRAYRFGQRTPSPKVLRALVGAFRKQARRLAKMADELEWQVGKRR
jgi:transcriptional regulator with XRE-family HTH domain